MSYPCEGYGSVTPLDAARVNRTILHYHLYISKKCHRKSSPVIGVVSRCRDIDVTVFGVSKRNNEDVACQCSYIRYFYSWWPDIAAYLLSGRKNAATYGNTAIPQ